MELVVVILGALTLLAAIAAAAGAWRSRAATGDLTPVIDRLNALEAQLKGELSTLRDATERKLSELGQLQSKSQLEFLDRLTRSTTESAEKQRRELTEAQALSRKETGDALAALREDHTKNSAALNKTLTDLQTQMLERLKSAIDAQRELADKSREAITEAQALSRKETGEALAALREDHTKNSTALNKTLSDLQTQMLERLKLATDAQRELADKSREAIAEAQALSRREVNEALTALREEHTKNAAALNKILTDLQAQILERLKLASDAQRELGEKTRETIATELGTLRKDNEARLEKLRETVDEKLQSTLEKRLGESFKQVSERLEQVHKGLGEMQQLATGVGDLKKVLTNVRTRGTYGEVQLRVLLEQVLNSSQYRENINTRPGSSERVEFAILLPGKRDNENTVYLPIDAKFPQEDYQRLLDAYENADTLAIDAARKALRTRILGEAKSICEKYVEPPFTTDFAMMFLPTEGLFAEVLRIPGLSEEVQTNYRVIIAGPTTLYAILNSLNMGFRTLAIEKRSSEVWKVLGAIKGEFTKFGDLLDSVSKNLNTAQEKLTTLRSTRVNAINRKLKTVEELPSAEAAKLLPLDALAAGADDDEE